MIGLTSHHKYHLYSACADMRKGFDGLSGLISQKLNRDPMDGDVYIFLNRRRDRMKLLVWEKGGYMLYYKRLEQGTFELPEASSQTTHICLEWDTLVFMIQGISLQKIVRKKRYNLG